MPRAKPRSFTFKSQGLKNTLNSQVLISNAINPTSENANPKDHNVNRYNAIWDTGATGTVITQKVVEECVLSPTGVVEVQTAAGKTKVNSYLAHVWLPNKIVVSDVQVTFGELGRGVDVLIGMNIIGKGDFAVTNKDEKTVFFFAFHLLNILILSRIPLNQSQPGLFRKKRNGGADEKSGEQGVLLLNRS